MNKTTLKHKHTLSLKESRVFLKQIIKLIEKLTEAEAFDRTVTEVNNKSMPVSCS